MAHHNFLFRQALGHGELDIVLVELVYHIAAHPHGIARHSTQRKRDCWQNPAFYLIPVEKQGQRKKARQIQLNKKQVNSRRHGVDKYNVPCADFIYCLALFLAIAMPRANPKTSAIAVAATPK